METATQIELFEKIEQLERDNAEMLDALRSQEAWENHRLDCTYCGHCHDDIPMYCSVGMLMRDNASDLRAAVLVKAGRRWMV